MRREGLKGRKGTCPTAPALHPILLDGSVVCRDADGVVAMDLPRRGEMWRSPGFPLVREHDALVDPSVYPLVLVGGDLGRCAVTIGGGACYAVGEFLSLDALVAGALSGDQAALSSTLAAF